MDHVKDYRPPKDSEDIDDVTKILREEGCAPSALAPSSSSSSSEENEQNPVPAKKLKKGEVSFMSKVNDVTIHLSFIVNGSKITPVDTLLGLVVQSCQSISVLGCFIIVFYVRIFDKTIVANRPFTDVLYEICVDITQSCLQSGCCSQKSKKNKQNSTFFVNLRQKRKEEKEESEEGKEAGREGDN